MRVKPLKVRISRDLGMLLVLGILIFWSIANRNEYAAAIAFMYVPVGITILYYLFFVKYSFKMEKPKIVLVLIFVFSSLSTLYYSSDTKSTISAITASCLWILLTLLVSSAHYEPRTIVRILNIYTIIAALLGINTLYSFATGMINPDSDRVVTTILGTLKDNNFYASFLTPAYAYSFYRFVNVKRSRMCFLAAAAVLFIAIIFTGSRAAFITQLIIIGITVIGFMLSERMSFKKIILLVITLCALVVGYIYVSNTTLYQRLTDAEDYSTDIRIRLWNAALDLFAEKPIFGGGRGAVNNYTFNRIGNYVHNTYLEILCDQGLVGAGLFLGLFVSFFKVKRENVVFVLVMFIAFFLPLLFISAYQSCGFWLGIALCLIFAKYLKNNTAKALFEGREEEA